MVYVLAENKALFGLVFRNHFVVFGFGPSNSFDYYKYINLYSEVMQCQIITLMFCRKITSIFAIY